VKFDYSGEVYTITFDDEKTSPPEIIRSLEKGGFKIKGEPTILNGN
jgi:hypothetical protein